GSRHALRIVLGAVASLLVVPVAVNIGTGSDTSRQLLSRAFPFPGLRRNANHRCHPNVNSTRSGLSTVDDRGQVSLHNKALRSARKAAAAFATSQGAAA